MNFDEIVDRLEQFGYHLQGSENYVIIFIKNKCIYEIKNICNIDLDDENLYDQALENLKYKAIDKICAEFLLMKLNAGSLDLNGIDMSQLGYKSVTEGDTSVTFATDGGETREQALRDYLTKLSTLDKEELYKFRKMEW